MDNIYIKANETVILSDQEVDSTYILYKDGRLLAHEENLELIKTQNEYNPFMNPVVFFSMISEAEVDTTFINNGVEMLVLSHTKQNSMGESNFQLWLDMTNHEIFKLKRFDQSKHLHLCNYYEVNYEKSDKDNPHDSFEITRSKVLSLADRSIEYNAKQKVQIGDTLYNYSFLKLNGDSTRLTDYKNDYYLLYIWYIGCPPCMRAIPAMNKAFKKFDDVSIIGINTHDSNLKDLMTYKKRKEILCSIFYTNQLTKDYHFAYPTFIVLDSNLVVLKIVEGYTEPGFEELVDFFNKDE